jgi:hypothetical protein
MKKFVIKVCLFAILIGSIDLIFGYTMSAVSLQIDTRATGSDNYICDKAIDDILIFGSSRAKNHYNAQMISDSLGLSCYNCGESGCGIILAYGRLLMLLERHTPHTIIYEITPEFDLLDKIDNHRHLANLKRHYDRAGIDSIFWSVDHTERYKMVSGMYRHNTSSWRDLFNYLHKPSNNPEIRGFFPVNREMDSLKMIIRRPLHHIKEDYVYDSLKIQYLNKFIDKTNGVNLIFVVSPTWSGQDTIVLDTVRQICKDRDIPFLDYSNSPKYIHHNEYFLDGSHLNARGADEFTRDIIYELRKRFAFTNN